MTSPNPDRYRGELESLLASLGTRLPESPATGGWAVRTPIDGSALAHWQATPVEEVAAAARLAHEAFLGWRRPGHSGNTIH